MQLKLAFLDPPNPPPNPAAAAPSATARSHLDKALRVAALEILARMLSANSSTAGSTREASDE